MAHATEPSAPVPTTPPSSCATPPLAVPQVTAPATTTTFICHAYYITLNDDTAKVPRWVAYTLTGDHALGCIPRTNDFHDEPQLPLTAQSSFDYRGSGYDQGHQAPAQDFAWDAQAMIDSFSMANMAPQVPGLNRLQWEQLEETVRSWALLRGPLTIYVGPVLRGGEPTIGPEHVVVPTAFWKVIVDKDGNVIGFEMPNQLVVRGPLDPYQVPVSQIEADAQIRFPFTATGKPPLWPSDLPGWQARHQAACQPAPK